MDQVKPSGVGSKEDLSGPSYIAPWLPASPPDRQSKPVRSLLDKNVRPDIEWRRGETPVHAKVISRSAGALGSFRFPWPVLFVSWSSLYAAYGIGGNGGLLVVISGHAGSCPGSFYVPLGSGERRERLVIEQKESWIIIYSNLFRPALQRLIGIRAASLIDDPGLREEAYTASVCRDRPPLPRLELRTEFHDPRRRVSDGTYSRLYPEAVVEMHRYSRAGLLLGVAVGLER